MLALPFSSKALIERIVASGFCSAIISAICVPWPFESDGSSPSIEIALYTLEVVAPVSISAMSYTPAPDSTASCSSLIGFSSSVMTVSVWTISSSARSASMGVSELMTIPLSTSIISTLLTKYE